MPRCEGVGILIVVVYLPPGGKGDIFQPGVRGRAAGQAVVPRVGHVGVGVPGGAVGVGGTWLFPYLSLTQEQYAPCHRP